jgi:hypothetical protein
MDRVPNPALNLSDGALCMSLEPSPIEGLGGDAELDDEIA